MGDILGSYAGMGAPSYLWNKWDKKEEIKMPEKKCDTCGETKEMKEDWMTTCLDCWKKKQPKKEGFEAGKSKEEAFAEEAELLEKCYAEVARITKKHEKEVALTPDLIASLTATLFISLTKNRRMDRIER
jgi:hypothetical protein